MAITKWRLAYVVAFLVGTTLAAYLVIRFVRHQEQAAIDSQIVSDLNPLIEAELRSLAQNDAVLARCGKFSSWKLENWGRFSRPMQPRLFINGTVHFEKADLGCIVTVVHGLMHVSLQREPADKWLNQRPQTISIVARRLEVRDDYPARLPPGAAPGTAQPAYSIGYGRFDGEATHPAFVPD